MTLCGVLKNILLVVASVLIWGTVVGWLQIFGYGVALAGLVYYGVGYDGIQTYYHVSQGYARKMWEGHEDTDSVVRPSFLRRVITMGMYITIVVLLVTGIAIRSGHAPAFVLDLTEHIPSF